MATALLEDYSDCIQDFKIKLQKFLKALFDFRGLSRSWKNGYFSKDFQGSVASLTACKINKTQSMI